MKLHHTAIERLIEIYSTHGGYQGETRLRDRLVELDLTTYDQKEGTQDTVLVVTKDLEDAIEKMLNTPAS